MGNVKHFPNHSQIKDEAAAWVVKIHGYCYKTGQHLPEKQALDLHQWMSQSELHRQTFLKILGGWDAMAMLEDLADILPLEGLQKKRHFDTSLRWASNVFIPTSKLGFFFSSLATSALAMLLWLVFIQLPTSVQYSTEVGEQASISLDDGSTVLLNTDSLIEVDLAGKRRVINLLRGEANFQVAKDIERPFVVYAGDGMVWAVGTSFNVDYRGDYVDVLVSEGTVKVFSGVTHRNEEPLLLIDTSTNSVASGRSNSEDGGGDYYREVLLDAGESAQYSQSRVLKERIEPEVLDNELAWQTGVLVFQGETLQQALIEISRYTDRQLVIIDPTIGNASVGGRFKTDDIDDLVNSLALGLDIKTEMGEGDSILFSAK